MDDVLKAKLLHSTDFLSAIILAQYDPHTVSMSEYLREIPLDWGGEEQKKQTKFNDWPPHCVLIALTNA